MKSFVLSLTALTLTLNVSCHDRLAAKTGADGSRADVMITTTVSTRLDLPECDAASQDVAAYIVSADRFVKCSRGSWRSSTPGSTETHYLSRTAVRFYEWEDRSSKLRWSLPSLKPVSAARVASQSCLSGWKIPSREELVRASQNGLIAGMRSRGGHTFDQAWTSDFETIGGVSQRIAVSLAGGSVQSEEAAVYCVSLSTNS